MKRVLLATALIGAAFVPLQGCVCANPPETVAAVDINRYMGLWYEIAKYPFFFERGLVGVTAEYSLNENGTVKVVNRGFKETFDGELSEIEGKATVADKETNAKLTVQFGPFPVGIFGSNYWIIMLGDDYEYAVVSSKCRDTLWILSRTPQMDEAVYNGIVAELDARGFDTSKLEPMPQQPAA
ncbi:MAG: lipocalin family protein [Candidatus Hydrogenedentes bacterium]|nr:lipocalin family protein [Candidatus Hydrogenedentota bacterium]